MTHFLRNPAQPVKGEHKDAGLACHIQGTSTGTDGLFAPKAKVAADD
jgi:hypothetical protein